MSSVWTLDSANLPYAGWPISRLAVADCKSRSCGCSLDNGVSPSQHPNWPSVHLPLSWSPCLGRSRCRWLRWGWPPPSPRHCWRKSLSLAQTLLWAASASGWSTNANDELPHRLDVTCAHGCSWWPVCGPAGPSGWFWSASSSRSSSTSPGWRWTCLVATRGTSISQH